MNKIVFVVPYPFGKAPSQRFRYEQYLNCLTNNGHIFEIHSFLDDKTWEIFYKNGYLIKKIVGIILGFLRRFLLLFKINKFDYVFIHREATLAGPPWFEWVVAKIFKKKIIYDFDDAIWLHQFGKGEWVKNFIKYPKKVQLICSWSYKVSAGNNYLCSFAEHFTNNVVLNPTTIDTVNLHNQIKNQSTDRFVIGWTGTHSTLCHLETKINLIRDLENEIDFDLYVIANKNPEWDLKSFKFLPWNKFSEISDLLNFNVGLMPLQEDEWTEGKCGFKALQYMSLGVPAIVSPVGVNSIIIIDGVDGYICNSDDEWKLAIKSLYRSVDKRVKMGAEARKKVESEYSVLSNQKNFMNLFS
ncbi:glycosyltransferase [Rufibacter aurantiacus]|uniref:glycosyltransferase n=1 Tax=Rufibacter aurantiacus TaxID=2817374 RepID=UPI001B3164D3|nr:glycosyltransferase [Rufibacter aurantiacus]